jgi:hypothetical protein
LFFRYEESDGAAAVLLENLIEMRARWINFATIVELDVKRMSYTGEMSGGMVQRLKSWTTIGCESIKDCLHKAKD